MRSEARTLGAWLLAALLLLGTPPVTAQESATGETGAGTQPTAEESAPAKPKPPAAEKEAPAASSKPGPFVPTERIDAESVVSFPADI